MTDNPTSPVTFSAEERAMLDGTATVKLEESTDGNDGLQPEGTKDGAEKPVEQVEGNDGTKPGPEAEEESDEEVTEVADGTNPDAPARRKVIAFSAYEKQRQAKKALAEEAAKLREQVAYLSGLSQNAPQNAPKPQPQELSDTPPDKTKEPEKYLAWLESAAQEAIRIKRQSAQHSEQTTQFQQINQAVFDHEQAFINGDPTSGIEAHPDFNEAVKHLQNTHKAELRAAGYDANEIQQIMTARAQSVAIKALQQGKSPAERVYELAKLAGYKRAAPAKVETEAEKIARQAKSQEKAGKTISSLPGGESKGGLTAEALANMDPMAFKKSWDSGEAKALLGWKD